MKIHNGKIMDKGFGQIATSVMEYSSISLGARALYVYFICKSGASVNCFPSNATIMKALGIKTKLTLNAYKNELIANKLLKIEERTYKSGKKTSNYYYPVKMASKSD